MIKVMVTHFVLSLLLQISYFVIAFWHNALYADSLLANEAHEEDVSDVEGCFELQCNQVFIGMVTMQYQAQIDMVCIVHWPYCTVLVTSSLLFSQYCHCLVWYFISFLHPSIMYIHELFDFYLISTLLKF